MTTTQQVARQQIVSIAKSVLWEGEADSLRVAVENAVKQGAHLGGADLRGADLGGAHLGGADLGGADLPTGEKWEDYRKQVVPALLNGSPEWVEKITNSWKNHSWENCPLATRYQTNSLAGLPILLRPRGEQFIQFFDAGLLDDLPEELGWTKASKAERGQ